MYLCIYIKTDLCIPVLFSGLQLIYIDVQLSPYLVSGAPFHWALNPSAMPLLFFELSYSVAQYIPALFCNTFIQAWNQSFLPFSRKLNLEIKI